jgi:transposase
VKRSPICNWSCWPTKSPARPATKSKPKRCGQETSISGYDESERLDVEPARHFVQLTKREKRTCRGCEQSTVKMAPLPPRIVEKGLASDNVVIDAVVSKYCDHLPL